MGRQGAGLAGSMPSFETAFVDTHVITRIRADRQGVPGLGWALNRMHHVALDVRIHIPKL